MVINYYFLNIHIFNKPHISPGVPQTSDNLLTPEHFPHPSPLFSLDMGL